MKKDLSERLLELAIFYELTQTNMFKDVMDKMWKEAKEKDGKTLNT